ncbi:hypothetical protein MSAN_01540100 [Mycena sanguinolenta]|uniref:DUF6534 domain-containing protein n=1 Tax=Mycena sanguinolenta TaxID=230812 RepID=A0A8H6Y3L0_9AGAR|nr:hypothetical protein MSAN_01540100 [Mycena sanguinolenta]
MCDPPLVMSVVPESLDLNLQSTYGALLIGSFFSVAVWGVSLVQTILYFMMYEKDPRKLKFMILFLMFGHASISAGKQTRQLTAIAISLRASGAATDILIAGTMIYLLNQPCVHIPSMSSRTRRLLSRIIILSINSGAWTAILAVLDFIFIVAFPVDFTFCIFELPLCSLYLSTLLLNLNARKFIEPVQTNISLADITWSGDRTRSQSGETIPHELSAGPAYLSQAHSSATLQLQKLTLTLPGDMHVIKDEAVV